jgi:iron complex transport system permease protein
LIKNHKFIFTYLIFVVVLLVFAILSWGAIKIPFNEILNIVFGSNVEEESFRQIIWELRLPRAFCSMLAGAALGLAGLLMQTYFQNPLAGPFVLGIHSGSSLAVAFWIMTGTALGVTLPESVAVAGVTLSSILGGAAVFFLLLIVSMKVKGNVILLVIGLLFGYFTSGLISLLISVTDAQKIKTFLMWTLGSFQGKTVYELILLSFIIGMGLIWSLYLGKRLNALLLGEEYALSLGLNFNRFKIETLFLTSILSGAVTSLCGPIAFVGIMAPHIARKIFSSQDHFILIPGSFIIGSILCLLAEFLSGLGVTLVVPINAILGLFGAPFIVFFLFSNKRRFTDA